MNHDKSYRPGVAKLTTKQRECMDLLALEKSPAEIARFLGTSTAAVEQRLAGACQSMGAVSLDDAVSIYLSVDKQLMQEAAFLVSNSDFVDSEYLADRQESSFSLEEPSSPFDHLTDDDRNSSQTETKKPGHKPSVLYRVFVLTMLMIGFLTLVLIGLAVFTSAFG